MATRNIVPRANGEGSIGTAVKHWGAGHFDTLPNWQEYLAESTGYGIVSGCTPTISGLTVTVAAGVVHLAGGTRKELSATNITLDAADTTNPRIDLVYITSAGVVAKVTGTAAASPVVPALPSGGISVAQVSVAANATTGTLITTLAKNELPFVVDNVAELRASNFSVGRTVMTKGYYAENDGGAATYRIRTANLDVDDGGSIIILDNGNVAELITDGTVNVKQFGAKGDGVTDDTAKIQAAFNFGKLIYIPSGTYAIYDTTAYKGLNPRSHTKIIGIDAPTFLQKSKVCSLISNWEVFNTPAETCTDVYIEGITFDCNGGNLGDPENDNYSAGIYLLNCSDITINRCKFQNAYYMGSNLFSVKNQTVMNCEYQNIGTYPDATYPNYAAIGADGSGSLPVGNVVIRDNVVSNCGGFVRLNGGLGDATATVIAENFLIEKNIVSNCVYGINFMHGSFKNIAIKNNSFSEVKSNIARIVTSGKTYNTVKTYIYDVVIDGNSVTNKTATPIDNATVLFPFESCNGVIFKNNSVVIESDYSANDIITINDTFYNVVLSPTTTYTFDSNYFSINKCKRLVNIPAYSLVFTNNNVSISTIANQVFYFTNNNSNYCKIYRNVFNVDNSKFRGNRPYSMRIRDNVGYDTSIIKTYSVADGDEVSSPLNCQDNTTVHVLFTPVSVTNGVLVSYTITNEKLHFYIKKADGTSQSTPISIDVYAASREYYYDHA